MVRRRFTGEEVAKVLIDNGYYPQDRTGSHLKLRYEHLKQEKCETSQYHCTLRNVARQCGAQDFDEFCAWIDRNR